VVDDPPMRSVDEHLAKVLGGIGTVAPIELPLLEAQGLLLAENIVTRVPLPGFDNSAMDGYAVRAVDTRGASEQHPLELPVVGDVVAGTKSRNGMGPGLAMRIMTGAPVPAGADAVIPLEKTDRGLARVRITEPAHSGDSVRRGPAGGLPGPLFRGGDRPAADRPARRDRTGAGAGPAASPRRRDLDRQ